MLITKKRFTKITPIENSIYFVTTAAVNTTVAVPRLAEDHVNGDGTAGDAAAKRSQRPRRKTSIINEPKEPPIKEQ